MSKSVFVLLLPLLALTSGLPTHQPADLDDLDSSVVTTEMPSEPGEYDQIDHDGDLSNDDYIFQEEQDQQGTMSLNNFKFNFNIHIHIHIHISI